MADDRFGDAQELLAARVGALLALRIAQMMDPDRRRWTQQDLITTLADRGLATREIVAALGISRTIVDPILSRHRKKKIKKPMAAEG
jgi:hypothetical protein